MIFSKFWPRRIATGSSSSSADAATVSPEHERSLLVSDLTEFDLVTQLSYMSAVATAGLSRDQIFEYTARLPYVTSRLFRSVRLLARRLNYNYASACQLMAERSKNPAIRSLLLRFSSSLSSGEREADFLAREAEVELDSYANKYERDLESMKKWTDAYVTLLVSVVLVVIITMVSTMIYPMGILFMGGLAFVAVSVTGIGGWLIYRTSPPELRSHSLKQRSREQRLAALLARLVVPTGVLGGLSIFHWTGNLGPALLVLAVCLAPVGLTAFRYHNRIDKYDRDAAVFLRALGGITAALGTTVTEAIGKLDMRSLGALEPLVRRLHHGLASGIKPDLCWERFVGETGSELVKRSVGIFWDAINVGGDSGPIGYLASLYLSKMTALRAKRALVASTFAWLMVPMHAALTGLLIFIVEIVNLFSVEMVKAQQQGLAEQPTTVSLPVTDTLTFASTDTHFIQGLVLLVILVLTIVNSFVPNAASGGDRYSLCLYAALMLFISGLSLTVVPLITERIFGGILSGAAPPATSP